MINIECIISQREHYLIFRVIINNNIIFNSSYNKDREIYTVTASPESKYLKSLLAKRKWNKEVVTKMYNKLIKYGSASTIKGDIFDFYDFIQKVEKDLNSIKDIDKLKEAKYYIHTYKTEEKDYEIYKKLGKKKFEAMKELMDAINA